MSDTKYHNWPGKAYHFQPTIKPETVEQAYEDNQVVRFLEALRGEHGDSQRAIARTGLDLIVLLLDKNRAYGDSARDPVACFAKGIDTKTRMAVRMDDKISRLMRGDNATFNEDAYRDLAGYLVLYLSLEP